MSRGSRFREGESLVGGRGEFEDDVAAVGGEDAFDDRAELIRRSQGEPLGARGKIDDEPAVGHRLFHRHLEDTHPVEEVVAVAFDRHPGHGRRFGVRCDEAGEVVLVDRSAHRPLRIGVQNQRRSDVVAPNERRDELIDGRLGTAQVEILVGAWWREARLDLLRVVTATTTAAGGGDESEDQHEQGPTTHRRSHGADGTARRHGVRQLARALGSKRRSINSSATGP